jgi:hypothetical protein
MPGDYYHLALLYQIEQVAKPILRLEGTKLAQTHLCLSWLNLARNIDYVQSSGLGNGFAGAQRDYKGREN